MYTRIGHYTYTYNKRVPKIEIKLLYEEMAELVTLASGKKFAKKLGKNVKSRQKVKCLRFLTAFQKINRVENFKRAAMPGTSARV